MERENDVPESLKNYLLTAGLDAIEIHKPKDAAHYRWISTVDGETKWVATTLTFDAHCVEEFKRPHCTTHIKMTSLGLRDLSEALKFPDTRIRFPENLPDPPLPRVLGIQIKGGDSAFFKDLTIATAENLSCIIGVRGSGKSTIVEAIRYAFGYNRTLNELDKQLANSINAMQKAIRAKHNASNEQKLNRFLPEWMKVSIDFRPGRDTGDFGDKLQALLGARGNQVKKVKQFVEAVCTPVAFANMLRLSDLSPIEGNTINVDLTCLDFTPDDTQMVLDKTRPFEKSEPADVDIMAEDAKRLQQILDLQETAWDDFEAILLNGSPVNQRSPGQRSSAMLPLIALAETSPLVIDQPEDNLDKRLIGSVLMKVLADLKEKRQIIVCTHDPNILVGGDAEQVIVLEAESDRRGKVGSHGSIDNKDIIALVIDLLEGGAEAFETRKKRYGLT